MAQIAYKVIVDGVDIDSILRQRLISITHTDLRGFETDSLEIALDDSDGLLAFPPRGAVVEFSFGWPETGLVYKGSFTVDAIAHSGTPDVMTIRACSADLRSGLTTQRERSWHNTTLGNIITTIASENDLKALIAEELAATPIEHIDQTNESSVNLLTSLAKQFDAVAGIKNGAIIFQPIGYAKTASGKKIPTINITRKTGDHHLFEIADRDAYTGVRATYNDLAAGVKGEVIWGKAEDSLERGKQPVTPAEPKSGQYKTLTKTYVRRDLAARAAAKAWKSLKANKAQRAAYIGVKAKYADKNLGVSGTVVHGTEEDEKKKKAAQRLEKRDAERLSPFNAFDHSADNIKTLRHVFSSRANALRGARAEWRKLQRGLANFSITPAIGLPELFADTPISVEGFKREIDSTDWLLVKVTNTINGDGGYQQALELEIRTTEVAE